MNHSDLKTEQILGAPPALANPENEVAQLKAKIRDQAKALETLEYKIAQMNLQSVDDRIALESLPQLIWKSNADGFCTYVGPQWAEYTGLPTQSLLGVDWCHLIHPDDQVTLQRRWEEELRTGLCDTEFRLRRWDGEYRWFKVRGRAHYSKTGHIAHWFGTCTDIHNQKTITEALERTQNQFRGIFVNAAAGMAITNRHGYFTDVNPSYCQILGYSECELMNLTFLDVTHPDDRDATKRLGESLASRQKPYGVIEKRYVRKDGSTIWVEITVSLVRNSAGEIEHFVSVIQDISERKRADQALIESELGFRQLADLMPQLVWKADEKGRVEYVNQRLYQEYGYLPQECFEERWHQMLHPDDTLASGRDWLEAIKKQAPYQDVCRIFKKREQCYRWHLVRAVPVKNSKGQIIKWIGTCTDIEEQKQIEERLSRSEERLLLATTSSDTGIWDMDLITFKASISNITQRLLGLHDRPDMPFDDFLAILDPGSRDGLIKSLEQAIANKIDWVSEFPIQLDKKESRWIMARGRPLYDEAGRAVRMHGVAIDITKQKTLVKSLREARDAANTASQLKSAFLANMSHEIRTPLGAILGFSDLLFDSSISENDKITYHAIIQRNGEQLSRLIDDILDLSKIEAGQLKVERMHTNLSSLIQDVYNSLMIKAQQKGLIFNVTIKDDIPTMIGTDCTRLRQILMNVVNNAIKFTEKGTVEILAERRNGDQIAISVKDTGIGLNPTQITQLFKPFSQADDSITRRYGGTGLGLTLSRRLAQELGGDLILKSSQPGVGSEFEISISDHSIEIPTNEGERIKIDAQKVSNEGGNLKGLRVLLADDSSDNRALIRTYLEKHGVIIDAATNGHECMAKAMSGECDIILMDIQMPLMDGYTATQNLREMGFQKPIIALTAHAMNEVRENCANVGCTDYLTKPVNRAQLMAKLVQYLPKREDRGAKILEQRGARDTAPIESRRPVDFGL